MKIFRPDISEIFARQLIYNRLYDRTAAAVIECLKKHDDPNIGASDLTIRIVNRDMVDFKLDTSIDSDDYTVQVSVDRVVYNDPNSFRLYCNGLPNGTHSIIVRSDAGMAAPFIHIRDFFRLLDLVKHIVEGTPLLIEK